MTMIRHCSTAFTALVRSAGWCQHSKQLNKLCIEKMNSPVIYSSLNSILNTLNQNKVNNRAVAQLLELYHTVEISAQDVDHGKKRHPLIVVEGLDGSGKSTITKKLSNKIGAELYFTPPPIMNDLRPIFDNEPSFRSAFYSLGNYIASIQLLKMLEQSPVILDRFWHSTAAYAIAEGVKNAPQDFQTPPAGSDAYKWPADLLKPDIVFFLSVSEEVRLTRISKRLNLTTQEEEIKSNGIFRENIVKAYENMREPAIEKVNANAYRNKVVNLLYNKIEHLLITPSV